MPSKPDGGLAAPFTTPNEALDAMTEASRRQLAAWAQAGCALFRGFGRIRAIQERTAQDALAEYEQVAARLARPLSMLELLALQGELLRFDLQGAALYWQRLGAQAFEMQHQLLAAVTAAETTALREAAAGMQEMSTSIPGMPMASARTAGNSGRAQQRQH